MMDLIVKLWVTLNDRKKIKQQVKQYIIEWGQDCPAG